MQTGRNYSPQEMNLGMQPCTAKPRHSTFMTIIRVSQPRRNISRHGKYYNSTVIIAVIIFRLYRHRDRYTGFMGITAILWIYKINWLMLTFWYSWVHCKSCPGCYFIRDFLRETVNCRNFPTRNTNSFHLILSLMFQI